MYTYMYIRVSVNHNSLGCKQPPGLNVNQSLIVYIYMSGLVALIYLYKLYMYVLSIYTYMYMYTSSVCAFACAGDMCIRSLPTLDGVLNLPTAS